MRVCTLGDLTLDISVRSSGPLAVEGDTDAEIRIAPGGQAANVAAWGASLGARARCIAKRGADTAGRIALEELGRLGVDVVGPIEGRNGIICSLVSAGGERSMASDRGAARALRADEIDVAWLDSCDHLFISGYALLYEPARGAAFRAVELARRTEAAISVDLASWSAIRAAGAQALRQTLIELEPDVVFATENEEAEVGGPIVGAQRILKRGARGCSFGGDERPARPVQEIVDTTGAGDALAAGWIVGGPELALEAAARCVSRLGSMP